VRRACIDIGSNTTRLLVADCEDSTLREVHQERVFTRIGQALDPAGAIAETKLDEVALVVRAQLLSARRLDAAEVHCVATASVRRAANGADLVERVERACEGLRVRVLSGEDEARLAFLGASRTLERPPTGPVGVVDVGGGSTELVVGTPRHGVTWWTSLALGSADVTRACIVCDPPSVEDLAAAREHVERALEGVRPPRPVVTVAVGGSATSVHRLAGPLLGAQAFERSLHLLATQRADDVAREHGLDVERVRLMPAGLLILQAVAGRFEMPLLVGRGGVREGVLLASDA
jgi:exopolyphosphatase/guanosine-5'-triphosphate,3'-diphosphate pyrophosphatase